MATTRDLVFQAALSQAATAVEDALESLLPDADGPVTEAMRYATLSGGKRLRAFLVIESSNLFRVPAVQSIRAAAAVECLHAYSLIHDDLPAMDDDDMRRGRPTVHRKWDEATAILAGDALQAQAFEILAGPRTALDPTIRARLIEGLARASGARGMVGGQALDLAAGRTATPLNLDQITQLQSLKTGALIQWAAEAGAVMGKSDVSNLTAYARDLGLAFQIQDDILDVTGSAEETGKATQKDAAAGKATFVSLLGLSGARRKAKELVKSACDHLDPYGSSAENLRLAADFAISRSN